MIFSVSPIQALSPHGSCMSQRVASFRPWLTKQGTHFVVAKVSQMLPLVSDYDRLAHYVSAYARVCVCLLVCVRMCVCVSVC